MEQARLRVDIEKQLQAFHLRVRLEVGAEIVVLFGPSGAGKTTTLNCIAGLVTPDAGEIVLDERVFFRRHRPGPSLEVPSRARRVGYVFQQYLLFPHLTALENVAYPLWRQGGAHQQAEALLERMHLAHLADRYPHQLSGGQQQRVAIARALAVQSPILLLDEPFAALDTALRARLQTDLRDLQQELGLVVLYVTHRLEDAFAVGHRLAVLRDGHVEQVGGTEEVFRQPVSHHVAEMMGIRNLFYAQVVAATQEGIVLDWDGLQLLAPPQQVFVGATVAAYIRPEEIRVLYPGRPVTSALHHNQIVGRIVERHFNTTHHILRALLTNGSEMEVWFPASSYLSLDLEPGEEVRLSLRREHLVILNPVPKDALAAGKSGEADGGAWHQERA